MNIKQLAAGVVAVGSMTFGIAAPAFAEDYFANRVVSAEPGFESRTWYDNNIDATNGRVTWSNCTRDDFTIAAYREHFGPDEQVGRETVQCRFQADAVYWGDVPADHYHWTLEAGSNITGDQYTRW